MQYFGAKDLCPWELLLVKKNMCFALSVWELTWATKVIGRELTAWRRY